MFKKKKPHILVLISVCLISAFNVLYNLALIKLLSIKLNIYNASIKRPGEVTCCLKVKVAPVSKVIIMQKHILEAVMAVDI